MHCPSSSIVKIENAQALPGSAPNGARTFLGAALAGEQRDYPVDANMLSKDSADTE